MSGKDGDSGNGVSAERHSDFQEEMSNRSESAKCQSESYTSVLKASTWVLVGLCFGLACTVVFTVAAGLQTNGVLLVLSSFGSSATIYASATVVWQIMVANRPLRIELRRCGTILVVLLVTAAAGFIGWEYQNDLEALSCLDVVLHAIGGLLAAISASLFAGIADYENG